MSEKGQESQESQESQKEKPFNEVMRKFDNARRDDFSFAPRRSFVKGDINITRFSTGENGDIEINNVDKYGNAVFRDKFGNVKCISHEDLEAGLVPDLDYQEKYKMAQHRTKDGEVRASTTIFQDAFYDELEKQKAALAGKTIPDKRVLPTGKKFSQTSSLPALKSIEEIRQAFDQYGQDRNKLDIIADSIRKTRERDRKELMKQVQEKENTEKQGTKRSGVKILCGSCDRQLDSMEYVFCPYCGSQL